MDDDKETEKESEKESNKEEDKGDDEKENKTIKLPSITNMNALVVKGVKSSKNKENCQKIVSLKTNPKLTKAKTLEDKEKLVQTSDSTK
jgi:hypothetical protein